MPHIIIKLYPGRPESAKIELTQKIVEDVSEITGCNSDAISVAFEEIEPDAWAETVYKPDILNSRGKLYKEPGYNPFTAKDEKKEKEGLMDFVRGSAQLAEKEDSTGFFNPMSWLETQLEENPQIFDNYFDKPWNHLSEDEKGKRAVAIRRVL